MKADQALQTVVSVDDPSVQVIEIACGKAAAVKLDHRTEIWRNHGNNCKDHPLRPVA